MCLVVVFCGGLLACSLDGLVLVGALVVLVLRRLRVVPCGCGMVLSVLAFDLVVGVELWL